MHGSVAHFLSEKMANYKMYIRQRLINHQSYPDSTLIVAFLSKILTAENLYTFLPRFVNGGSEVQNVTEVHMRRQILKFS
jgi:hypothetical protein